MKHWKLAVALVCFGSSAFAQTAPPTTPPVPAELDASGITGLIADKLKEAKGAAIVTWGGKPGGAAYLPIWTWHDKAGTPYLEFPTLGYRSVQGQRPDAFTHMAVNLPAISGRLLGSPWAQDHISRSPFPPVFFGPGILLPLNLNTLKDAGRKNLGQLLRDYGMVTISVRFSPAAK